MEAEVEGEGEVGGREGERQIPGAGEHFVSSWQRQFEVDEERGRVKEQGQRIDNDTLFAFAFERQAPTHVLTYLPTSLFTCLPCPLACPARERRPTEARRAAACGA